MFLIVQFGGLLVAIFTITPSLVLSVAPTNVYSQSSGNAFGILALAAGYFIYLIIVAAILILIFKYYKGRLGYVLLEGAVVMLAMTYLFYAVLGTIFPDANPLIIAAICAVVSLILIIAKYKRQHLRNLLAVLSSMGIGVLVGLSGFGFAYFFAFIIAIYDYIAVFVTKHMITLAQGVSSRNLAFLIGASEVEAVPKEYLSKSDVSEFNKQIKSQKVNDPVIKDVISKGSIPVISQVQLGTGDLVVPLMIAVGVYANFFNYFIAMMVVIGASVGMLATMYLLKKYKTALPAIPPLFAFINLFLGISFAIEDFRNFPLWIGFFAISVLMLFLLLSRLKEQGRPS